VFIDTYKVGFAKLYDVKTAITAAELLFPDPRDVKVAGRA
jgi:hypothetical protein